VAKTRGKGEGSLFKDGRGLWTVRIELPAQEGKRRQKVIRRKSKKAAMDEMAALKAELQKHGDLPTSNITVEKWLRYWIDEIAPQEIRPKSYASYKSTVDGWLIPLLGKKKLDALTPEHLRQMFKDIQRTPKSPKLRGQKDLPEGTVMVGADTAIKAHSVLSSALNSAMEEGKANRNVCERIKPPVKAKVVGKALTLDQAVDLLDRLTFRSDGALWATYLLTGARRGEILGLEADRVTDTLDLSWQLLRITDISTAPADYEYRHLQGTLYLTRPKSRSGNRVLPLRGRLKDILGLHLQGRTEGLVFTDERGNPWDPDRATKEWAKLLDEAGLPTDIVLHGARHTAVDLMHASGMDWDDIKDIVGHSTRQMSKDYRTSTNMGRLSEGIDRLYKSLEPATKLTTNHHNQLGEP